MSEPDGPQGDATPRDDWQARRNALGEKLAVHKAGIAVEAARDAGGGMRGIADGLRLASEFVAGIVAGALLGYLFDLLLKTSPFGLIVFLLFGFVAGVLNVLRSVAKTSSVGSHERKDDAKGENAPRE